jgi:hypothetical protein
MAKIRQRAKGKRQRAGGPATSFGKAMPRARSGLAETRARKGSSGELSMVLNTCANMFNLMLFLWNIYGSAACGPLCMCIFTYVWASNPPQKEGHHSTGSVYIYIYIYIYEYLNIYICISSSTLLNRRAHTTFNVCL